MELLEGIATRRSFRAFKPTPVPEETISQILQAASNSPSYTNTQPWEVAIVTGKKRQELSKILYHLSDSEVPPNADLPLPTNWPAELEKRAREHGAKRFEILGINREDRQRRKEFQLTNFQFYGAPCALFLFMDSSLSSWSIFDIGLFAQNLLLAAHAFGLGSCLQASLANYPDAVRQFLGIATSKKLLIGISIGYPDFDAKINSYRSHKAELANFVEWHT